MSLRRSTQAKSPASISDLHTTPGSRMRHSEGDHKSCPIIVENYSSLSKSRSRKTSHTTNVRPGIMPCPISQSTADLGIGPVTPRYAASGLSPNFRLPLLSGRLSSSSFDSVSSDVSDVFDLQPKSSAGSPDSIYSDEENSFPDLSGSYEENLRITIDRPKKNSGYTADDSSPTKEAQDRRAKRQQGVRESPRGEGAYTQELAALRLLPRNVLVTSGSDLAQATFADFCKLYDRLYASDRSSLGGTYTSDGCTSTPSGHIRRSSRSGSPLGERPSTQPRHSARSDQRPNPSIGNRSGSPLNEQPFTEPRDSARSDQRPSSSAGGSSAEVYPHFKPYKPEKNYTRAEINLLVHKCLIDKELPNKVSKGKTAGIGFTYVLESPLTATKGYVKIGETHRTAQLRACEWKKCGLKTKRVVDRDENAFFLSALVEKLVHAELFYERRTVQCQVCIKKGKHTVHGEWFEIEQEIAFKHIENWRQWMKHQKPYYKDGTMKPYWKWEADQLTRKISSVDWNEWTKPGFDRRFRYFRERVGDIYASRPERRVVFHWIGIGLIMFCVLYTIYRFFGFVTTFIAVLFSAFCCYFYAFYLVGEKEKGGGKKRKTT